MRGKGILTVRKPGLRTVRRSAQGLVSQDLGDAGVNVGFRKAHTSSWEAEARGSLFEVRPCVKKQ